MAGPRPLARTSPVDRAEEELSKVNRIGIRPTRCDIRKPLTMKSEHRHELKSNELQKLLQRTRPFFEKYGTAILWGLSVVILLAAAFVFWYKRTAGTQAAGWTKLDTASTAEDYANIADRYTGTRVGTWARLLQAEEHLQNGVEAAFTDREAALDDLEEARQGFKQVLKSRATPRAVRERALLGLARCRETLSDGSEEETKAAIETYQQLLNEFPETIYRDTAEQRIAELKSEETREFYAWFHQQNPSPEGRPEPQDGGAPAFPAGGSGGPSPNPLAPGGFPPTPTGGQDGASAPEDGSSQTTPSSAGPQLKLPVAPSGDNRENANADEGASPATGPASGQEEQPSDETPSDTEPAEPHPAPNGSSDSDAR